MKLLFWDSHSTEFLVYQSISVKIDAAQLDKAELKAPYLCFPSPSPTPFL